MAINKGTIGKQTTTGVEYIYPKTSSDMVTHGNSTVESRLNTLLAMESQLNSLESRLNAVKTELNNYDNILLLTQNNYIVCNEGEYDNDTFKKPFTSIRFIASGYTTLYQSALFDRDGRINSISEAEQYLTVDVNNNLLYPSLCSKGDNSAAPNIVGPQSSKWTVNINLQTSDRVYLRMSFIIQNNSTLEKQVLYSNIMYFEKPDIVLEALENYDKLKFNSSGKPMVNSLIRLNNNKSGWTKYSSIVSWGFIYEREQRITNINDAYKYLVLDETSVPNAVALYSDKYVVSDKGQPSYAEDFANKETVPENDKMNFALNLIITTVGYLYYRMYMILIDNSGNYVVIYSNISENYFETLPVQE